MTSLVTLPGIIKDLRFRVHDDDSGHRAPGIPEEDEEDERDEEATQELELKQMNNEDDAYLDEMERRSMNNDEFRILHTSSPDEMMPRTVTIAEPDRPSSILKDDGSYPPSPKHLNRFHNTLQMKRSSTMQTFSTFRSTISDAWEYRHDASHKGFWAAVWDGIAGGKEKNDDLREGDPEYVPPKYRWTPILSGLLQPFSILLEIPSLTEHWYVKTVNNIPVVYQANPTLLDVGLGISMFCAVVANIALISRFLERRVYISTVTTIIGLSIHDIINITAITVFGVIHSVDDGFTYSEAFWLTVCSTVASAFTNATLIYDLVKTKDFRKSGKFGLDPQAEESGDHRHDSFGLYRPEADMVTPLSCALCFNFLLPQTPFENALYYTVVTIETIGFGDITPYTIGAKVFLFLYAPIGILNLSAVAVGTARDTLVESWNAAYRRRRHEVLQRHKLRKQQRAEEAVRRVAIERQLLSIGAPVYVDVNGGGVRGGARKRKLNVKALSKDQLHRAESEAMEENASKLSSAPGELLPLSEDATEEERKLRSLEEAKTLQQNLTEQSLLSEEGYREFQERIAKEEKVENLIKFAFAFSLFLAFWIVGATVFSRTEGWSWFIGFYFCFVSFTTIGYGEVYPITPPGRAFFIIWAIFGVATVTLLIAVLTEAYANRYKSALVQKGAKRAMTALREDRDRLATLRSEPEMHNKSRSERLPYEIIEVMKEWHVHVAASKHGNDTEMTKVVDRLLDEQGLTDAEKTELAADAESRRMLFWNGYEPKNVGKDEHYDEQEDEYVDEHRGGVEVAAGSELEVGREWQELGRRGREYEGKVVQASEWLDGLVH
ncbi:hypothetical protein P7C73_g4663, partial [Tremellales sp. Uapishka_1]